MERSNKKIIFFFLDKYQGNLVFCEFSSLKSMLPCYPWVTSGLPGQSLSLWHLCQTLKLGWTGWAYELASSLAVQRGQLRWRIHNQCETIVIDTLKPFFLVQLLFYKISIDALTVLFLSAKMEWSNPDDKHSPWQARCSLGAHSELVVIDCSLDIVGMWLLWQYTVRSIGVSQPHVRPCSENYGPRHFMLKATEVCRWFSDINTLPNSAWRI